jgi:TonB family protein
MIVKAKQMQIRIHAKGNAVFAGVLLVAGLLLWGTLSSAQGFSTSVTHFMDTNTDRVPLLTAFPTYPSIARRDRIQGEVTVCFNIKQDGRISRAKLQDSSHRIFKKPVLRAIKKSTFEPLGPSQILATAKTCRTYRFRLEPVLVENNTN